MHPPVREPVGEGPMLEHAIDSAGPNENPAPSPKSADDDYYVPKQSAEALSGRAKGPSVKRFNRKMIARIPVGAGAVVPLGFEVGLRQPKPRPPEPVATTAKPPV